MTVKYEGDPLPAERLKELVPVERDNSVAEDLLEDSVAAIRTYLRQQGYWKADATWRREESADALAIVFQIKKGLRYFVAEPVALSGNEAADAPTTCAPMIALKPGDLFLESGLSTGDRGDHRALSSARLCLRGGQVRRRRNRSAQRRMKG